MSQTLNACRHHPRWGGPPVTNIRNPSSPRWRGWLKPENRPLTPANRRAGAATLLGLRQAPVVSRHPQMVPAVGRSWHRGVAAKLRHDLVYFAKRPAALAVVEFEQ